MKWIVRVITAAVLYAASVQTAQACWGELTCEKTADTGEITSYPAIVNYRVTFNYSWMNDRCAVAYLTDSLLPANFFSFPQIAYDANGKLIGSSLDNLFWVNNPATGSEHVDYSFNVNSYEHCVSLSPFPPASDGSVRLVNSAAGGAFWDMEFFSCDSEVICRPPDGYCNRTPGYWKTHSSYGPARYDAVWANITPGGADKTFFLSGQTYYGVLWTANSASSNGTFATRGITTIRRALHAPIRIRWAMRLNFIRLRK